MPKRKILVTLTTKKNAAHQQISSALQIQFVQPKNNGDLHQASPFIFHSCLRRSRSILQALDFNANADLYSTIHFSEHQTNLSKQNWDSPYKLKIKQSITCVHHITPPITMHSCVGIIIFQALSPYQILADSGENNACLMRMLIPAL